MDSIEKRQAGRQQLLEALYGESDGNSLALLNMYKLGSELGLDTSTIEREMSYLVEDGLADFAAMGGTVSITHAGIIEVERARQAPQEPPEPSTSLDSTTAIVPQPDTASAIPELQWRNLLRTSKIPACTVTLDELRRLYSELDKRTSEAVERYLDSLQTPPDRSPDEFEQLKEQARKVGRLTIAIQGEYGEQIAASTIDALAAEQLPDRISSILFDTALALQTYNFSLPNKLRLKLDFSEPPTFATYDPFQQPTPNDSSLEVSGTDETWVTAAYQSRTLRSRSLKLNYREHPA